MCTLTTPPPLTRKPPEIAPLSPLLAADQLSCPVSLERRRTSDRIFGHTCRNSTSIRRSFESRRSRISRTVVVVVVETRATSLWISCSRQRAEITRATGHEEFAKEFMTKRVAPRLPSDSDKWRLPPFYSNECVSRIEGGRGRRPPRERVNQAPVNRRRGSATRVVACYLPFRVGETAAAECRAYIPRVFCRELSRRKKGTQARQSAYSPTRGRNTYKRAPTSEGPRFVSPASCIYPVPGGAPATILIIGRLSGITSLRATYEGVVSI